MWAHPHERIDDLQLNGLKIIQDPKGFCFGIDAVLLSNFTKVSGNDVVVEFGTGTGIIPILLAGKYGFKKLYAFEVQNEVANMAERSIKMNGLEDKIQVIVDNLKVATQYVMKGTVDIVVTNPPYMAAKGAIQNQTQYKAISRHEVLCNLEDVISTASDLLKFRGKLFMIHRPNRLIDIVALCRNYGLEPKVIRMVQPYCNQKANIVLIMCVKGGKPELVVEPSLIVYEAKGQFTKEIYEIYGSEKITSFTKEERL